VVKPQAATFSGLDAHWPQPPALLTVKQADAEVSVLYIDAATSPSDAVSSLFEGGVQPVAQVTWQGLPAVRVRAGSGEALAASQGDAVWVVVARGRGAHALLESLLPEVSLTRIHS